MKIDHFVKNANWSIFMFEIALCVFEIALCVFEIVLYVFETQ